MIGTFMAPLDASIVNTVLPAISEDFHTEIPLVQWVPTIYLLTICCLILLFGRLGDMIGCKKVFLSGLAAFTVTSAICGVSQNIWMLIVFRGLQGLAASMLMAVGVAIVTAAFPPYERGKAMGFYAVCIAAALGLGPVLGGIIAEHGSWRWVFFINIPIGLFAVMWGRRTIPAGQRRPDQRLDFGGAVTSLAFLFCLVLYANRGESWGWLAPESVTLVIAAVVFFLIFIQLERRTDQPMLNLALFRNRVFSFANASALLNFMALYAVVFLAPFYLRAVLHYKYVDLGLVMAASPVATLFVAPISGSLSDRIGTRPLAVTGMAVNAVGLFLLSELDISSGATDVAWRMAIMGAGSGMFQSPNNSAVMGSVHPMFLGISSGVLAAMRNLGMVLGLAVAGAVLYHSAPVAAEIPPERFTPADLPPFLDGMRWAFLTGAGFAAASATTSMFARGPGKRGAPVPTSGISEPSAQQ